MKTYGWYEYSDDPWVMRNTKTGQELRMLEKLRKTVTNKSFNNKAHNEKDTDYEKITNLMRNHPNSNIVEFLYCDHEIEQKISATFLRNSKCVFIDYNLIYYKIPTYGYWRRIDDFLADALLCSDIDSISSLHQLFVVGGWYQGSWAPHFIRKIAEEKGCYVIEDLAHVHLESIRPHLYPLDSPAPQWSYVDFDANSPNNKGFAETCFLKSEITLDYSTDNDFNVPFIPREQNANNFHGKVPYLARNDGKAFIYISRLIPSSHCGNGEATELEYTYIDENFFFTFGAHHVNGINLLSVQKYGFRSLPPEPQFWPLERFVRTPENPNKRKRVRSYLTYNNWKELTHTITDAWPKWGKRRIEVHPSIDVWVGYGRSTYAGANGPHMTYGYSGGIPNNHTKLTFGFL